MIRSWLRKCLWPSSILGTHTTAQGCEKRVGTYVDDDKGGGYIYRGSGKKGKKGEQSEKWRTATGDIKNDNMVRFDERSKTWTAGRESATLT